jgi:hypothetical protein
VMRASLTCRTLLAPHGPRKRQHAGGKDDYAA